MKLTRHAVALGALLAGLASAAPCQTLEEGVLLAASADVGSHAFARSIVLVIHHDTNGSIGLIVNRPTSLPATGTFTAAESLGDYAGRVFIGGPVAPTSLLMLVRAGDAAPGGSPPIVGDVHVLGEPELVGGDLAGLPTDESGLRVYAGRIQWQPEQLAREVADGRWQVLPGSADTVFTDEPLTLYRELSAEASGRMVAARGR